jgi:cytochrome P450
LYYVKLVMTAPRDDRRIGRTSRMAIICSQAADPQHVRAAPCHPNPYPYYGRLARERSLFRDEMNGWWVAASAATVKEVLESDFCLTRAPGAISSVLQGPAAEIFGRIVRLRDDETHDLIKSAVAAALRGLDLNVVAGLTQARATELDDELGFPLDEAKTTRFMFALPVQVIARLLGIPRERYGDVVSWLGGYVSAASSAATGIPAPDAALFGRGHHAAQALIDLIDGLDSNERGPLLNALVRQTQRAGCTDRADITANAIGYMLQGYAATAALIGLTLLALARRPELRAQVETDRSLLRQVIQEVLRFDPTTNSTYRFLARDGAIAGQELRQGDMIIVLIAAANRDPALNPEPDLFDIARRNRKYLEFGAGAHACPADKFAPLIAMIAVDHLLTRGVPLEHLESCLSYVASGYLRIPLFRR